MGDLSSYSGTTVTSFRMQSIFEARTGLFFVALSEQGFSLPRTAGIWMLLIELILDAGE